jgi:hypothetical protein
VQLTSDNKAVSIPATVTIPAGAKNAAFTATAASSAQSGQANITATSNGASQVGILDVAADPPLTGVSFDADNVVGGTTVNCTIGLGAAVPTNAVVSLTSTNPAAHVPASVTISAGTFP